MICKTCGKDLPLSEYYFNRQNNKRFTSCKACVKERVKQYQAENAERCAEYKHQRAEQRREHSRQRRISQHNFINRLKTPCLKCGEKRWYCIDFHHIDPSQKLFNIQWSAGRKTDADIEAEAKKCACLCRNCHAEFHYLYGQTPKDGDLQDYLNNNLEKENENND